MEKGRKDVEGNVAPPILVILGGLLVSISGLYSYLLKPQYTAIPNFATFSTIWHKQQSISLYNRTWAYDNWNWCIAFYPK